MTGTKQKKKPNQGSTSQGYNVGDSYEETIFQICLKRKILPKNFRRGRAGNSADIKFIHMGKAHNLEIKVDLKADFGQKMLKWEEGLWNWRVEDETTQTYTNEGVLTLLEDRKITPYLYTKTRDTLTLEDKKLDQKAFEHSTEITIEKLFSLYRGKDCHYIQVGGYGFYFLDRDILGLGVPQFDGKLKLRFRAKTINSIPLWNYGFYAVLKIISPPTPSQYDIEEKNGRKFPPIKP